MDRDDICFMAATELRRAFDAGELTPVDAVDAVLERIDGVNPGLNAFVTVLADEARENARLATQELGGNRGDLGPLHGIPMLIKDLTPTAGVRTTFGSSAFSNHVPTEDSAAWGRMKAAGGILIGKTTTPDFGQVGVTKSSLTGITNNPWDLTRTAGGSSGGSASAIVAGLGHLAWGSDGGGSIRIPASCCGAVGLKASLGRIPGYGELPSFESVVTTGPITRNVADTALLLDVTAGPHIRDAMSLPPAGVRYQDVVKDASVKGVRIAYSPDLGQSLVSADVAASVEDALEVFRDLGATVEKVRLDLPDALKYFVSWWGPEYLDTVDSASDEAREALPPEVHWIADMARGQTTADVYKTSYETRATISDEFARIFEDFDVIVAPTMPMTAFPHPGPSGGADEIDGQPIPMPYLYFHRMTEPFSHAMLPAISIPCGFDPDGIPVGLQIAGNRHDDASVLRAAAAYEAATPWSEIRPA